MLSHYFLSFFSRTLVRSLFLPTSFCSPSSQGKCLITVQLCEEEQPGDVEGVEFYLLFAGTTQSHITSALRSGHDILQALCPGKANPQSFAAVCYLCCIQGDSSTCSARVLLLALLYSRQETVTGVSVTFCPFKAFLGDPVRSVRCRCTPWSPCSQCLTVPKL